ncbi:MAG: 6-pyruvoyl-tetrahydropterin synthase-related protein, partial [Rhodoferax sp.]|nr:6-pyruvoyl-tetrahydropterin synthase-related protein [Rhodoferax sp.]
MYQHLLKFCTNAARFAAVWVVSGVLAMLVALPAGAGNIGFSIRFTGDEIAITNTGNEPAYQVSEWTLDAAASWQRVQVLDGNAAYLAPGQSLTGRRFSPAAPAGLGRADPLLVLLHDQAGGRIAQLAWRQAPLAQQTPLPTQRQGEQLSVAADTALAQKIIASYGLVVPYEGISQLGKPLLAVAPPPNPLRHVWRVDAPLRLATGAAQGGAWLVHENAAGELHLQIVPDGVVRGQEQMPSWLVWLRKYGLQAAAWLGALGALLVIGRWVWAARHSAVSARGLRIESAMTKHRAVITETPVLKRSSRYLLDVAVVLVGALLVASVLGIGFLLSGNLPTGGDSASHLLYLWTYTRTLLPSGQITAWMPEVFGGFAFLSYYFPLSFISIAALAQVLPFAPAMKIGMFVGAMLLPGTVWLGSVYLLRLPRAVAIWGVLASLAFLLHEQNSIWGGNLLSTLAGEFAYSYGLLFSVLTLMAWQHSVATGRHWWLAALLEAATGFSHGFALLITGFATAAFLLDMRYFWRNLRLLALGHGLAFFLLAGWLWPMLQMHSLTIPNDALFEVTRWQELLPKPLQPLLVAGLVATLLLLVLRLKPVLRVLAPDSPEVNGSLRHAAFMAGAALLAGVGFLAGGSIGVANIRFFPFVWLVGG